MVRPFPVGVRAGTDTCGVEAGAAVLLAAAAATATGRALDGKRAVLVARRRLGNKVGGRTYSSMVSRRNLDRVESAKDLNNEI